MTMRMFCSFLLLLGVILPTPAGAGTTSYVPPTPSIGSLYGIDPQGIGNEQTIQALADLMKTGARGLPNYPLYFFSGEGAGGRLPAGVDTNSGGVLDPLLSVARMQNLLDRGRVGIVLDNDVWDSLAEWNGSTRLTMTDRSACADPHEVCAFMIPLVRDMSALDDANRWRFDCTTIVAVGGGAGRILVDLRTTARTGAWHIEGGLIQNCEVLETADMDHIGDGGSTPNTAQITNLNMKSTGLFGGATQMVTAHGQGSQTVSINNIASSNALCCATTDAVKFFGFQRGGHVIITPFVIQSLSAVTANRVEELLLMATVTGNLNIFMSSPGISFASASNANNAIVKTDSGGPATAELVLVSSRIRGDPTPTAASGGFFTNSSTNGSNLVVRTFRTVFSGNDTGIQIANQIATPPTGGTGNLLDWFGTCEVNDENTSSDILIAGGDASLANVGMTQVNAGWDENELATEWTVGASGCSTAVCVRTDPEVIAAGWSFGADANTVDFGGTGAEENPFVTTATSACGQADCTSACKTQFTYMFPTSAGGDYWIPAHLLTREINGFSFNKNLNANLAR